MTKMISANDEERLESRRTDNEESEGDGFSRKGKDRMNENKMEGHVPMIHERPMRETLKREGEEIDIARKISHTDR